MPFFVRRYGVLVDMTATMTGSDARRKKKCVVRIGRNVARQQSAEAAMQQATGRPLWMW